MSCNTAFHRSKAEYCSPSFVACDCAVADPCFTSGAPNISKYDTCLVGHALSQLCGSSCVSSQARAILRDSKAGTDHSTQSEHPCVDAMLRSVYKNHIDRDGAWQRGRGPGGGARSRYALAGSEGAL